MDPPALINGGAFPGAGAPYNLAEIWPFQLSGRQPAGGAPGLRGLPFGQGNGIVPFPNGSGADHEARGDGPASLEQKVSLGNGGGGRKRRELEDKYAKAGVSVCNGDGLSDSEGKRLKISRDEAGGDDIKSAEAEPSSAEAPAELPRQDYIHVRARRGQATDSHSLAERARREKISERMKILQDLVPGCSKVIGKALVLDEIINYVQSLQRQVEFLSMKLEAVNSRLTPGIEVFSSKDFGQQTFDAGGIPFVSQAPNEYPHSSSPDWLHMQVGGSFDRRT